MDFKPSIILIHNLFFLMAFIYLFLFQTLGVYFAEREKNEGADALGCEVLVQFLCVLLASFKLFFILFSNQTWRASILVMTLC